jgi:hypothetical protein
MYIYKAITLSSKAVTIVLIRRGGKYYKILHELHVACMDSAVAVMQGDSAMSVINRDSQRDCPTGGGT